MIIGAWKTLVLAMKGRQSSWNTTSGSRNRNANNGWKLWNAGRLLGRKKRPEGSSRPSSRKTKRPSEKEPLEPKSYGNQVHSVIIICLIILSINYLERQMSGMKSWPPGQVRSSSSRPTERTRARSPSSAGRKSTPAPSLPTENR